MLETNLAAKLPPAIASYVKASNDADGAALLGAFTGDALVNDVRREYWGKDAIKAWAEREIFGAKVTMDVVRLVEHYGDVIVTAKMDGTYDKTGLPDPLVLTFYFTLHRDKIAKLIILHNTPAA